MEIIVEYVTVLGPVGEMVKLANEHIKKGYEPFGSPVYMGNNQFVQPMVRRVGDKGEHADRKMILDSVHRTSAT